MAAEEQLQWEARTGRLAAAAAFLSALLLVASFVAQVELIRGPSETDVESVQTIAAESTDLYITAGLQSLGVLLLSPVLYYLYRVTKARRAELPQAALVLAIAGPLVSAVVGVLFQVDRVSRATGLIDSGPVTPDAAADFAGESDPTFVAFGFGAGLAIGFAFVLINLNAMRAGVLSRFMAIIGIIIGALFVIPLITSPFVVLLFWTAALGVLFLDKWPGGRGPAWGAVEAIPWPSAAEQREAAMRRREAQEPASVAESATNGGNGASAGPTPPKRKRKRRR